MARYLELCPGCKDDNSQTCDLCDDSGMLTTPIKKNKLAPPQPAAQAQYPACFPGYAPYQVDPNQQLLTKIMLYFVCGSMITSLVCSALMFL